MKRKNKVFLIIGVLLLTITTYYIGYGNGQASVYLKVENDKKLQKMLYGG
jgi:hypothetical protein